MGEGIAHIVSPMSAPWCGWTMLVLMMSAVLGEYMQPGAISQTYDSLKIRTERTYKDAPANILAQALMTFFRVGTPAMAVCLCLTTQDSFSFAAYLAVCGVVFGFLVVKMLCNVLIDYTFQLSRNYGDAGEHYRNIFTMAVTVLYPLVLLALHVDSVPAIRWMMGGVAVLFLGLWLYRSAFQFVRSPFALLCLVAHIATLEILPLAGIVLLSAKMISIL